MPLELDILGLETSQRVKRTNTGIGSVPDLVWNNDR